ncbi:hypothetical protein ACHQM5_020207 [Ranunculus cassubicifolius]
MAVSALSLSLKPPTSPLFPQKPIFTKTLSPQITSFSTPISLFSPQRTNSTSILLQRDVQKNTKVWRISVSPEDVTPIETTTQQISTYTGGGMSNIISSLLFIAFIGLSILTIGVVYIAVTDFLQKREKDKFEKEETEKKSRKKKKGTVRARAGPKGFGQKIEYDDD